MIPLRTSLLSLLILPVTVSREERGGDRHTQSPCNLHFGIPKDAFPVWMDGNRNNAGTEPDVECIMWSRGLAPGDDRRHDTRFYAKGETAPQTLTPS